jgi:hypothetical protein
VDSLGFPLPTQDSQCSKNVLWYEGVRLWYSLQVAVNTLFIKSGGVAQAARATVS